MSQVRLEAVEHLVPETDEVARKELFDVCPQTAPKYCDFFARYLNATHLVEFCQDCELYGHAACGGRVSHAPRGLRSVKSFVASVLRKKSDTLRSLLLFRREFERHECLKPYLELIDREKPKDVREFLHIVYTEAIDRRRLQKLPMKGYNLCYMCHYVGHRPNQCKTIDWTLDKRVARRACARFKKYIP